MGSGARVAAIFVQRGAEEKKQEHVCLTYCLGQRWTMFAVVPYWAPEDAVAMVVAGTISVVLVAFDSPAVRSLAADVGPGGRVIAVHPTPTVIEPPRRGIPEVLATLIVRWWRRGWSVKQIASEIEGDTTDVRAVLRREGEQPDRSD